MRNVWRGMVIGAITGAGIGVVLDLPRKIGRGAAQVAKDHGPDLIEAVKTRSSQAVDQAKKHLDQP